MVLRIKRLSFRLKQAGFSLLQTAVLLTVLAGLATVLVPYYTPKESQLDQQKVLNKADKAIQQFIARHSRLPCPDSDNDGYENCTLSTQKGFLPLRTLGIQSNVLASGNSAIQYGVFRAADDVAQSNGGLEREDGAVSLLANDADLASLKNRYQPTMSGGYTFDFTGAASLNGLDLCAALNRASDLTFDSTKLHINHSNGQAHVAYALALPGLYDADGDGNVYDGVNSTSNVAFQANSTVATGYDDVVLTRSFNDLKQVLACETAITAMDMAANSVLMQKEVIDEAEDMKLAADMGASLAAINVALLYYDAAIAAWDLINAVQAFSVATGLLSGAVASCVVLVGCALIPVYTASVLSAALGVATSNVAIASSVAAVAAQAVATGLYIDVAVRAGAAIPDSINVNAKDKDGNPIVMTAPVKNATVDYSTQINQLTSQLNDPQPVPADAQEGNQTGVTVPGLRVQASQARETANSAYLAYINPTSPLGALDNANAMFQGLYSALVNYNRDSNGQPNPNGQTNENLLNVLSNYQSAIDHEYDVLLVTSERQSQVESANEQYRNAIEQEKEAQKQKEKLEDEISGLAVVDCSQSSHLAEEYCQKSSALAEAVKQHNNAVSAVQTSYATYTQAQANLSSSQNNLASASTQSRQTYDSTITAIKNHPVWVPSYQYNVSWQESVTSQDSNGNNTTSCQNRLTQLTRSGYWIDCSSANGETHLSIDANNLIESFKQTHNECANSVFISINTASSSAYRPFCGVSPNKLDASFDAIEGNDLRTYQSQPANSQTEQNLSNQSYINAILIRKFDWYQKDQIANEKEKSVADIEAQIAKMQCLQTPGKTWFEDLNAVPAVSECRNKSTADESSFKAIDTGAVNILQTIDEKGIYQ